MKSLIIIISLTLSSISLASKWDQPHQEQNLSEIRDDRFDSYGIVGPEVLNGTYTLIRDHETPSISKVYIRKAFPDKVSANSGFGIEKKRTGGFGISMPRTLATDFRKVLKVLDLDFSEAKTLEEGQVEKITLHLNFEDGVIEISNVDVETQTGSETYKVKSTTWWLDDNVDEEFTFSLME